MAFWLPKTITCWGFSFYFCDLYVGSLTSLEGRDSNWPELASFVFFPWHVNQPSSYSDPKCCLSVLAEGTAQVTHSDTVSLAEIVCPSRARRIMVRFLPISG